MEENQILDREQRAMEFGTEKDVEQIGKALEYKKGFENEMKEASDCEIANDPAGAHEHRQRAHEVYGKLYEELGPYPSEEYADSLAPLELEKQIVPALDFSEEDVSKYEPEIRKDLAVHSRTSEQEYTYVIQERNEHLNDQNGTPIDLEKKVIKVDHPGQTAAQIAEKAGELPIFSYLCSQDKIPISENDYRGEKPETEGETDPSKMSQRQYEEHMTESLPKYTSPMEGAQFKTDAPK